MVHYWAPSLGMCMFTSTLRSLATNILCGEEHEYQNYYILWFIPNNDDYIHNISAGPLSVNTRGAIDRKW